MSSNAPLVLVTSANGKQGRAIISTLLQNGISVRAFVHSTARSSELHQNFPALKAESIVVGDFLEYSTLDKAMHNVDMVVHIGPPFHQQESAIGTIVIDAARRNKVKHFILSSVLYPMRSKMVNHKSKLLVEEYLVESELGWTILQPTHLMQTLPLSAAISRGTITLAYPGTMLQGFLDLADMAEVVLKVVQSPEEHHMAIYPLVGWNGTYNQVAEALSKKCGKEIKMQQISIDEVMGPMKDAEPYFKEGMSLMNFYYNRHGIPGNTNVLRWLLGREPSTWETYLERTFNSGCLSNQNPSM